MCERLADVVTNDCQLNVSKSRSRSFGHKRGVVKNDLRNNDRLLSATPAPYKSENKHSEKLTRHATEIMAEDLRPQS